MRLFLVDVVSKSKTSRVLVYAQSSIAARAYLRNTFTGCELQNLTEVPEEQKHFVLAAEQI